MSSRLYVEVRTICKIIKAIIPINTYRIIDTHLCIWASRSLLFKAFCSPILPINLTITYCPTAKIRAKAVKTATSNCGEFRPPVKAAILTIDESIIRATIMTILKMIMILGLSL